MRHFVCPSVCLIRSSIRAEPFSLDAPRMLREGARAAWDWSLRRVAGARADPEVCARAARLNGTNPEVGARVARR